MDASPGLSAAGTADTLGGRSSGRPRSKPREFWRNEKTTKDKVLQFLDFPEPEARRRCPTPSAHGQVPHMSPTSRQVALGRRSESLGKPTQRQPLQSGSLHQAYAAATAAGKPAVKSTDGDIRSNRKKEQVLRQKHQLQTRDDSPFEPRRAGKAHNCASPGKLSTKPETAAKAFFPPDAAAPATRLVPRTLGEEGAKDIGGATLPVKAARKGFDRHAPSHAAALASGAPVSARGQAMPDATTAEAHAGGQRGAVGLRVTAVTEPSAKPRKARDPVLRSVIMVLDVAAAAGQPPDMAAGRRSRRAAARSIQQEPQVEDRSRVAPRHAASGSSCWAGGERGGSGGRGNMAVPPAQAAVTGATAARAHKAATLAPQKPTSSPRKGGKGKEAGSAAGSGRSARERQEPGPALALPLAAKSDEDDEARRFKKRPRKASAQEASYTGAAAQPRPEQQLTGSGEAELKAAGTESRDSEISGLHGSKAGPGGADAAPKVRRPAPEPLAAAAASEAAKVRPLQQRASGAGSKAAEDVTAAHGPSKDETPSKRATFSGKLKATQTQEQVAAADASGGVAQAEGRGGNDAGEAAVRPQRSAPRGESRVGACARLKDLGGEDHAPTGKDDIQNVKVQRLEQEHREGCVPERSTSVVNEGLGAGHRKRRRDAAAPTAVDSATAAETKPSCSQDLQQRRSAAVAGDDSGGGLSQGTANAAQQGQHEEAPPPVCRAPLLDAAEAPPARDVGMPAATSAGTSRPPAARQGHFSPSESIAQSEVPGLRAGGPLLDRGRGPFPAVVMAALSSNLSAEPELFGAAVHAGGLRWSGIGQPDLAEEAAGHRLPSAERGSGGTGRKSGATHSDDGGGPSAARAGPPNPHSRPLPPPPRFNPGPCFSHPGLHDADLTSARNFGKATPTHGGGSSISGGDFFLQRSRGHGAKLDGFPLPNLGPHTSEGPATPEAAFPSAENAVGRGTAATQQAQAAGVPRAEPRRADLRAAAEGAFRASASGSATFTAHGTTVWEQRRVKADTQLGLAVERGGGSGASGQALCVQPQQQCRDGHSVPRQAADQRPAGQPCQQFQPPPAFQDYCDGARKFGAAWDRKDTPAVLDSFGRFHGACTYRNTQLEAQSGGVERFGSTADAQGQQRVSGSDRFLGAEPCFGFGGDASPTVRRTDTQPGISGFGQPPGGTDPLLRQFPDSGGEPRGYPAEYDLALPQQQQRAAVPVCVSGEDQAHGAGIHATFRAETLLQQGAWHRPAASAGHQQGLNCGPSGRNDQPPLRQAAEASEGAATGSRPTHGTAESLGFQLGGGVGNDRCDVMDVDHGNPDERQPDRQPAPVFQQFAPPQLLPQAAPPQAQQLHRPDGPRRHWDAPDGPLDLLYGPSARPGPPSCGQQDFRQPLQAQPQTVVQAEPWGQRVFRTASCGDFAAHPSGFRDPPRNPPSLPRRHEEQLPQQQQFGNASESVQEDRRSWRPAEKGPASTVQQQQPLPLTVLHGATAAPPAPQPDGTCGFQGEQPPPPQQQQQQHKAPRLPQFMVPLLRTNRLRQHQPPAHSQQFSAQQPMPQRVSSADGRTALFFGRDRAPAVGATASAPAPAVSTASSAAESIRRALSRADGIQQRSKTRQQEVMDREEDGWTLEQIQELQAAYYKVEPTHPSFWCEVAKHVHGKTAAECFSRVYTSAQDRDERVHIAKLLRRQPAPSASGGGAGRPLTLAAARKWSQKVHEREQLARLALLGGAGGGQRDEEDDVEQGEEGEGPSKGDRRGRKAAAGARRRRAQQLPLPEDPTEILSILEDLKKKTHADRFITSFLHKQGGWAKWHRAVKEASERRRRDTDAAGAASRGGDSVRAPGPSAKADRSRNDTLTRLIRQMLLKEKAQRQREEWREDDRAEGLEDDDDEGVSDEDSAGELADEEEQEKKGHELLQYLVEEGLVGPDGLPVL